MCSNRNRIGWKIGPRFLQPISIIPTFGHLYSFSISCLDFGTTLFASNRFTRFCSNVLDRKLSKIFVFYSAKRKTWNLEWTEFLCEVSSLVIHTVVKNEHKFWPGYFWPIKVIERLNKGHTTLAFSLLSKFQVFEFASNCSEEHLQELIFSLKSGFFALSGDNSGENNLDFDLPDSNDSTDLVKAILAKQTCDIIRARPEESARDILQTLLQISSVGDGVNAVWDRIKEAFVGKLKILLKLRRVLF